MIYQGTGGLSGVNVNFGESFSCAAPSTSYLLNYFWTFFALHCMIFIISLRKPCAILRAFSARAYRVLTGAFDPML